MGRHKIKIQYKKIAKLKTLIHKSDYINHATESIAKHLFDEMFNDPINQKTNVDYTTKELLDRLSGFIVW